MKTLIPNSDREYVLQLKKKYFSDPSRVITLRKDNYLIKQNVQNRRLYLVLEGLIAGYIDNESGNVQEIFRSVENMFVGVHSFFSKSYNTYADVLALEDTKLAYIDMSDFNDSTNKFILKDFVPVIVHELSARQRFSRDMMYEKEAALRKLLQSEKLATLGQMAAGLAHELNNAIGVINGNSSWLAQRVFDYFKESESKFVFKNFERGFEEGQSLSSNEVRNKKKTIEKMSDISSTSAKKLAQIGFNEDEIQKISKHKQQDEVIDRMHEFWELGVSIHDIILASKHAVHVLKSIKQLSVTDQARYQLNLNDTIEEALTLLKNLVRHVNIEFKPGKIPDFDANNGELVQIWVNIIKNGCESMLNAGIENPTMIIKTGKRRNHAWITITDNGPGIPEEMQKKIFQPNFTTKKGGLSFGLGLGLSIVQRLVDSYNGKISVDSKKGETTFSINILIK